MLRRDLSIYDSSKLRVSVDNILNIGLFLIQLVLHMHHCTFFCCAFCHRSFKTTWGTIPCTRKLKYMFSAFPSSHLFAGRQVGPGSLCREKLEKTIILFTKVVSLKVLSIKREKEINRSESRQSWSGVGQFNSFVCVYARCTAWALICTLLLNVCVKVMSRNLLGPWWLVY